MRVTRAGGIVVVFGILVGGARDTCAQGSSAAGAGALVSSSPAAPAPCRIDFGATADDFGSTAGCPGPSPLTSQFTFTQKIVFGASVSFPGGPVPPAVMRTDARCLPPCRSAGAPTFTTDWWCEFRAGTSPGVPGAPKGVNGFSAEVCFVDNPANTHPLLIAYDASGAVISSAVPSPVGGPVQVLTVTDALMQKGIRFVQVDSSGDIGGLSVDCLNYDEPDDPPTGGGPCAGVDYQVLTNGLDVIYLGVGAGGSQTQADGLGTWMAGEDMRGSHLTVTGDFGYRSRAWRESACVLGGPIVRMLAVRFRGVFFIELDGLNANNQAIFRNPACTSPSFPLGTSGFIPYGVGPGSSASFVLAALPAGVGPAPSTVVLLPNNGLVPSSSGGQAIIVGAASNVNIPINSTGFCWGVQFEWIPSAVALDDDIDGLWHYVLNSTDGNQYWGFSNDELNIWQSNTVATNAGLTQLLQFLPSIDYVLLLATSEPSTSACLAPRGTNLAGPYYGQSQNVGNQVGASLNPNGGFDVGRGSAAISFSGTAGVPNPATGVGNQNAVNNPGTVTTLGFATWDNGGDGNGSVRLTWVAVDLAGFLGQNPALDPGILKFGGTIRLPVPTLGLLQPITNLCFNLFQHVTSTAPSGWPDPDGFTPGSFDVPAIAGASWQLPTGPQPAACVGTKLNLTYGTSGRTGGLGTAGPLTYDPCVADISGSRELYLFN